jgi:hypothetical protein
MLELSYGIIWADIVMVKQGIEVYKNNTKLKDVFVFAGVCQFNWSCHSDSSKYF